MSNVILFPYDTPCRDVITRLMNLVPEFAKFPGRSKYSTETLMSPDRVEVHVRRARNDWGTGALSFVTITYEREDRYGIRDDYKEDDTKRSRVGFKRTQRLGNPPYSLDVDEVAEKFREMTVYAKEREEFHRKRRLARAEGAKHANASSKEFDKKLLVAGFPRDSLVGSGDTIQAVDHDTRRNIDRPVHLILNLSDELAIGVLKLIAEDAK